MQNGNDKHCDQWGNWTKIKKLHFSDGYFYSESDMSPLFVLTGNSLKWNYEPCCILMYIM